MSIQILPEHQSAAAGIGSGFGKGLAQQLPEEIKRYRLASGLKAAEEGSQGRSLYQNISALAPVLQDNPGLMNTLIPLLQQQGAISERNQANNPGGIQNISNPNIQGNLPSTEGSINPRAILNNTPVQENFNPTQALSQRLLQTQRLTYPTPQLADEGAEKILEKGNKAFDEGTKAYLQKDPDEQQGEIGGLVRQQLREKMQQEIANSGGRNPEGIAKHYYEQARELAKEQRSIRDIASSWTASHPPDQTTLQSLRKSADRFKIYGIPSDVVIDDLIKTQHISRSAASYIYDDLKGTEAGKILYSNTLPKSRPASLAELKSKSFYNREAELAKKLLPAITNTTPIGSLAYIAEQKGYDGNKLMAELQKIADPSILLPQQLRDMRSQNIIPMVRSIDEQFLLGWLGNTWERGKVRSHRE